jgi:O-antigen biosynthesis protein
LSATPFSPTVDVIVPVYRDFDVTRSCICSVLQADVATPFRLLVVDDVSPDPELSAWLDGEARDPRVTVLRNAWTQGFARSVNRGMALHTDHDVVLLNSDARVHGNWLDRLRACAYRHADTGTVTPLTDNGTLASYPRFMAENAPVSPDEGAVLDTLAARVNTGLSVPVPTAVGFCMYIRRDCLEQAGFFDAHSFGRGYGEENEFCVRAADLGWSHRLCGDAFVHHRGGASFGEGTDALKLRATEVLERMHPDYPARIRAFVESDPGRPLRRRLDLARLSASPRPRILFVTHRQGGGVERHCEGLAAVVSGDMEVLALMPDDDGWLKLQWLREGEELTLFFRLPWEYGQLRDTLRELGVSRVHVHHVMEHPQSVLRLSQDLGVPMDFTIHDYYGVCPQYNLTDEHGEYCGEPDSDGCTRCLAVRPAPWGLDIHAWRSLFRGLLARADRILAPSDDARRRLERYVPEASIRVLPHFTAEHVGPVPWSPADPEPGTVRVLVLGVLTPAKGVRLLERCAWDARHRNLPLYFHVLGRSDTEIPGLDQLPLEFSGPYRPDDLPGLIREARGHVFFFPSRAPETFSYTLGEALETGLPLAVPARGAFVERTRGLERVCLVEPDAEPGVWNDHLLQLARTGTGQLADTHPAAAVTPADYRQAYLQGLDLRLAEGHGAIGPERLDELVTAAHCYGPARTGVPIGLSRRSELLEVLGQTLPESPYSMDTQALEHWLQERSELESRAAARERALSAARESLEGELGEVRAAAAGELRELRQALERAQQALAEKTQLVDRVMRSPSMRLGRFLTAPLRAVRSVLFLLRDGPAPWHRRAWRVLLRRFGYPVPAGTPSFDAWVRGHDTLDADRTAAMQRRWPQLERQPTISLLTPTYNTDPDLLRETVQSVLEQVYPHWELVLVDDASTAAGTLAAVDACAAMDPRVKVVHRATNGHICAASNTALAAATGEWVGLLDHDDLLAPDALYWVAEEINAYPDSGLIYSDEDKLSVGGGRQEPHFKPDWNPDLLRSQNYINHFSVYRRRLLAELGGFREGFEGAQDYDLALRVTEGLAPEQIRHIPRILYHWRCAASSTARDARAKPYASEAARRALSAHLERTGQPGAAVLPAPGFEGIWWRVRYPLPEPAPRVSVLIPTRNRLDLLSASVSSVLDGTDYPDCELILIDNGSDDRDTLLYLESISRDPRVRVIRDDRAFNYSRLNNLAAGQATGSVLVLMNNDVTSIDRGWLREMVSHAVRPEIGVVGARLWYPDGTLQHAGCILGVGGVAGHAFHREPRGAGGYFGRAALIQNYSAVTGACAAIRTEVFREVGGLNEQDLQVAFNDIDLCLRVLRAGYRNLWTPYANLYHLESASRGYEDTARKQLRFRSEIEHMRRRWGDLLDHDPAYNPNLSLRNAHFALAADPRLPQDPWVSRGVSH